MTAAQKRKSLLEVQFPIAQLSLESFLERSATHGKTLNSLGKWWGAKPFVLTRAIILAALFEASDDHNRWAADLQIFLRLLCLDSDGMWHRRNHNLSANSARPAHPSFASLCYPNAKKDEVELFIDESTWRPRLDADEKSQRQLLEKRVFFSLDYPIQRRYCKHVQEVEGPPRESWLEINKHCATTATSLREWVEQISKRRFGKRIKVGDAFSGMGSIPFEAARLGCDVSASDINPVASLLTWGALNVVGGSPEFHESVAAAQLKVYDEVAEWIEKKGIERSEDGLQATLHFYCLEVPVPEWDGWQIPVSGTWRIAPKSNTWIELVPNASKKRFEFKVRHGGEGFGKALHGTKRGMDLHCPDSLWKILHEEGKTNNATRRIPINTLIRNHGGLRLWGKDDFEPAPNDFYRERLYCIRWLQPAPLDESGRRIGRDVFVYRAPTEHDIQVEDSIHTEIESGLASMQKNGWIPDWRIQDGVKTREVIRTRGWTYWHHLFNARQLLLVSQYSKRIANLKGDERAAATLNIGLLLNYNSRLCHWHEKAGGGVGSTGRVFYNQALNTFPNYPARSWASLRKNLCATHENIPCDAAPTVTQEDARSLGETAELWITDPPYADAVVYAELSEFFLAWYKQHIKSCFPDWTVDSLRGSAVQGDDAGFRVAMAECYGNLARQMPDDGLQVLMFTHKDTEVWEDLALIMWAAGLQVKRVWSVATETGAGAVRKGNYVQATYNMVLRKRPANAPVGFDDMIVDEIQGRVKEVITHMRESQSAAGSFTCGYTDTDYLLAAQAVAAEVITGYASISGINLNEELRTPNNQRDEQSVLRTLMNQAKREAVDFLVPTGLEEHLRRTPDGGSAAQFWRQLAPEEKFLLKGLELEAGGEDRIGAFQDLGRAYGIADYEDLLGEVRANNARTRLPSEFPRPDMTRWDDIPSTDRDQFDHSVTRHLYYAMSILQDGADMDRAMKHLVDCTNFWEDRHGKHLVLLAYLYHTTEVMEAWADLHSVIQTLRLAVENHRP
ncbi:DUF1156 domain-containing protein [Stieleria sp. TO1_6]|uniref:DUF1156 domain-containing protein n=1 Tax=Stieleria tagensis TaxID=2956795 RepID=UPI00209ABBA6|nr:DUF1156 domain-containing protein [Stieleria tagensis]MCO8122599.1 DUF1156 domain-containing protein [Stieleria tagensis]